MVYGKVLLEAQQTGHLLKVVASVQCLYQVKERLFPFERNPPVHEGTEGGQHLPAPLEEAHQTATDDQERFWKNFLDHRGQRHRRNHLAVVVERDADHLRTPGNDFGQSRLEKTNEQILALVVDGSKDIGALRRLMAHREAARAPTRGKVSG